MISVDITGSIRTRHIQTDWSNVQCLDVRMAGCDAADCLAARQYDGAPVVESDRVIGFALSTELGSLGATSVAAVVHPMEPSLMVSAEAPLSRLLRWLPDSPMLFVLGDRDISGLVTPWDLNKQAGKTYFYLLLADFELTVSSLLRSAYRDQQSLLPLLGDRQAEVRRRWSRDLAADINADLISCMQFADFLRLGARCPEVLEHFKIESVGQWKKLTGSLDTLRNDVMHTNRSLLTRSRPITKLVEADDRLRLLLNPQFRRLEQTQQT